MDPVHAIAGLQTIDIPLAELITLIPDPPHAYVKLRSNAVDLGWLLGDCNKRPVITVDVVDRAATIVVYKGDRASSSYCPDVANANGLTITFFVALESVKAEVHEGIPGGV